MSLATMLGENLPQTGLTLELDSEALRELADAIMPETKVSVTITSANFLPFEPDLNAMLTKINKTVRIDRDYRTGAVIALRNELKDLGLNIGMIEARDAVDAYLDMRDGESDIEYDDSEQTIPDSFNDAKWMDSFLRTLTEMNDIEYIHPDHRIPAINELLDRIPGLNLRDARDLVNAFIEQRDEYDDSEQTIFDSFNDAERTDNPPPFTNGTLLQILIEMNDAEYIHPARRAPAITELLNRVPDLGLRNARDLVNAFIEQRDADSAD